jgi:hypothetical protein
MKCKDIERLIYLVHEDELTDEEKKIVAEHIQNCPQCRELVRKVKSMVSMALEAEYESDIRITNELITAPRLQDPAIRNGSYKLIMIKAAAACLLLFLASTFVMQERSFSRDRAGLEALFQQDDPGLSDCIKELRRKIHYHSIAAFARPDTLPVNLVDEEALTAYVRENCGYNKEDIKALKKLLIQAGLSD